MNVLLGNFVLLPLAVLVLTPLLVHLFARSRPPRFLFSSVVFLRRIVRQTTRLKRPRDWFILAIRTILAAGLVGAFLRPVCFSGRALADPFARRHAIVIVDRSASMACLDGGQTRFSAACAEASEILAGLTARDAANLIWLDAAPHAEFPEAGPNVAYLQDALRKATVSREAGAIADALRQAVAQLADADGIREITLISDFQASAYAHIDLTVPIGITLVCVPVADGPSVNTAIADLLVTPATALPDEPVEVRCDVWNYSDQPLRTRLFAELGEAHLTRDLMLPAWGKTVVALPCRFPEAGLHPVRLALSEDGFPADDTRFGVVTVRAALRAALVGDDPQPARTWARALQALGGFSTTPLDSAAAVAAGEFDTVLVSGWNGQAPAALIAAANAGAVVLCAPAEGIALGALQPLLTGGAVGATNEQRLARQASAAPWKLRVTAPDDEVFELFRDGIGGDPAAGLFYRRLALPQPARGRADTLLAYQDGIPALARSPAARALYVWNLDLEPGVGNWVQQPAFLPFLAELLMSARRHARQAPVLEPGVVLHFKRSPADMGHPVTLITLQGNTPPPALRPGTDQVSFTTAPVDVPALYGWRCGEAPPLWVPVNFPSAESDLRTLDAKRVLTGAATVVETGRRARQLRDGIELWPWLLGLAMLMAAVETIALWRLEGGS